jgi:hypothetical protein
MPLLVVSKERALLLLQVQGHREVERRQGHCAAPAAATTREHVVPAHTGEDPPLVSTS